MQKKGMPTVRSAHGHRGSTGAVCVACRQLVWPSVRFGVLASSSAVALRAVQPVGSAQRSVFTALGVAEVFGDPPRRLRFFGDPRKFRAFGAVDLPRPLAALGDLQI